MLGPHRRRHLGGGHARTGNCVDLAGLGTRTDKPILIFWVGANGRIEPEAADNRPEGRKGVSLCGCSRLSSRDRTIPVPAALDGNPYRRSNPEPGGPRYRSEERRVGKE